MIHNIIDIQNILFIYFLNGILLMNKIQNMKISLFLNMILYMNLIQNVNVLPVIEGNFVY